MSNGNKKRNNNTSNSQSRELQPGDIGERDLVVRGARTHNLQNVDVSMPRNQMVVFTGLSGSGKSSLAFDTIFAEGQRRYMESLSSYARQFLQQMQKPDVDEIRGLSPSISIDQKSRSSNPRSTVATITEIYDYLRVLYARIGRPHCLVCGREIERRSHEEMKHLIIEKVEAKQQQTKQSSTLSLPVYVEVFAPVVRGRKGEYYQLLYDLLNKGYGRVRVDGTMYSLRDQIILDKNQQHNIDVLVDQINIDDFASDQKEAEERLSEALEYALNETDGLVRIAFRDTAGNHSDDAGILEDTLMSSNYTCPYDGYAFPEIEPRLFSFNSPYGACPDCNGIGTKFFYGGEVCPRCGGKRLREESLQVYIGGSHSAPGKATEARGKSIVDFTDLSVRNAKEFIDTVTLTERERNISSVVLREIEDRLQFMIDVGIGYLTLNRSARTLSGGEAQRIRLATQLGSKLVGALYVLDEPTIGLHARDNERLVNTLKGLRDIGNTIIVVEHDEDTIRASDYLVDFGPGAGVHGGRIVADGSLSDLLAANKPRNDSLTLKYLRGEARIMVPAERRTRDKGSLKIKGANAFNITNLDASVPLNKFITVTGVSGSGKSTFVYEIIHKNLRAAFKHKYRQADSVNCASFTGTEYLGRTVLIDQSPIGRTPRSNPATYTGAFTPIRDLFAETPEAKARGWKPRRFSFNVKGGRCETCQGNGYIAVEMHFLPTVFVPCDVCTGKRFMKETLEVTYRGKNIYEVLRMTVEEALSFFDDIPAVADRLQTLFDVGLGYLELGQSATTLSGGEAQRVKMAAELYKHHMQKTFYILDEPTIGLHYEDVKNLIGILQQLVELGNTVMVIEHNMDLIKSSDYIIDIGPDGGEQGGEIVARGTPEEMAKQKTSYTGQYLKHWLDTRSS